MQVYPMTKPCYVISKVNNVQDNLYYDDQRNKFYNILVQIVP